MPRQVLRWDVPVDDEIHPIGSGKVVMVGSRQPGVVEVWTDEADESVLVDRFVQVFAAGHLVPELATHIGSTIDGGTDRLVWHVFQVQA